MTLSRTVIGVMLAIATLGLVFSEALTHSLYASSVEQRIDDDLAQEVQELRALAANPDPNSGEGFASVEDLLYAAMQRNVPNRSEEFLVMLDGKVPFISSAHTPMNLHEHEALLRSLQQIPPGQDAQYRTVKDERGHKIRLVAVPVQMPGDTSSGLFVAAIDLSMERSEFRDIVSAQILAAFITLLLIGVVGTLVLRRVLQPLRNLTHAAEQVNDHQLDARVPVHGPSDLALLSHTFNGMLDRLDSAMTGQRALLDDVGHELRTPITVIRGHLEILDVNDPADTSETRDLVLDEADRMSRLVDEIILLAKSERADFLRLEAVDVDAIIDGVLERGRTLADRQFRRDSGSAGTIVADSQRLTQALLQLLSNAIRHTGDDDQIAVGARLHSTEDAVEMWVRDTGTGIEPSDHERIFRRFERGSTPTHNNPSSGLGLSIVAAIAAAHGGRVDLVSAPGRGSTFTLVIPNGHHDEQDHT